MATIKRKAFKVQAKKAGVPKKKIAKVYRAEVKNVNGGQSRLKRPTG